MALMIEVARLESTTRGGLTPGNKSLSRPVFAELEHEIQSTSRTKKHDFVLLDNFRDVKIPKGTHQQLIFWQLWLGPFKLPCNDKD